MSSPFSQTRFCTLIALLAAVAPEHGLAQPQTRYIDDTLGDSVSGVVPEYSPEIGWSGSVCGGCAFHPDSSQLYQGTWHDNTHHTWDTPKTVDFNFTGTSLEVYCVLPNPSDPVISSVYNLTFLLDGKPLKPDFTHETDNSNVYHYNVSVLSISDLAQISHSFTMQMASTAVNSTLQFDYARYIFSEIETSVVTSSPSSSDSSHEQSSETTIAVSLTSSETSVTVTPAKSAQSSSTYTTSLPPTVLRTPSTSTGSSPSSSATKRNVLPAILGGTLGGIAIILAITLTLLYRRYKHRLRHRMYASAASSSARIEPFYGPPMRRPLMPYNEPLPPPYSSGTPPLTTIQLLKRQQQREFAVEPGAMTTNQLTSYGTDGSLSSTALLE